MSKYVVSTLASDNKYVKWVNVAGTNTVERSVLVKGGAGVASKGKGDPVTREGVSTSISDDEAKFLAEHKQFQEHQKRGHVKIITVNRDADAVAQAMTTDDGSRPKNPGDVKEFAEKNGSQEDGTQIQVATNKGRK